MTINVRSSVILHRDATVLLELPLLGSNSAINKILIIRKEFRPGRFTVVLIKEPVGA